MTLNTISQCPGTEEREGLPHNRLLWVPRRIVQARTPWHWSNSLIGGCGASLAVFRRLSCELLLVYILLCIRILIDEEFVQLRVVLAPTGEESHSIHSHRVLMILIVRRNECIVFPSTLAVGFRGETICVIRAILLLLLHINPIRHSHGSCLNILTPANLSAVFLKCPSTPDQCAYNSGKGTSSDK